MIPNESSHTPFKSMPGAFGGVGSSGVSISGDTTLGERCACSRASFSRALRTSALGPSGSESKAACVSAEMFSFVAAELSTATGVGGAVSSMCRPRARLARIAQRGTATQFE